MKNRYIGENIRTIIEIIEQLNVKNQPGLIIFADFTKAFDSLDHDYIFSVFEKFNFGEHMINWIKPFYNNISSIVINNGNLSQQFNIERGVRQGCPLSSIIFILCIEILSNRIEQNDNIKGIQIGNKEIKQSLFADDATFFNNGDEASFKQLFETLNTFSKVSGLNLNTNKTTILRVGSLKHTTLTYLPNNKFVWTSTSAKTIGINFYNDTQETLKFNLEPKLNEFKNCLKQWQHRKLTLMGKITVIKTFALPKLIYLNAKVLQHFNSQF